MSRGIITPRIMKEVMEAKQEGLNSSQISKELNLPYETVRDVFREARRSNGFRLVCLEVPEDISEEEAHRRIINPHYDEEALRKIITLEELEEIYIEELNKDIRES
ncbi:MAG: hypothetical protein ACE5OZ_24715 [Candidatus Heimdallarchaeota archaeon]